MIRWERNAVTRSARAAALRSTAIATTLALIMGAQAWAGETAAKRKTPLPKARPIVRNVAPKAQEKTADKKTTDKKTGEKAAAKSNASL